MTRHRKGTNKKQQEIVRLHQEAGEVNGPGGNWVSVHTTDKAEKMAMQR